MNQDKFNNIVNYSSKIISEKKIGSRFESNDIQKIWLLGDLIISSIKEEIDYSFLLPKLKQIHESKGIRYDDRLYRASITFRTYWPEESQYKNAISYLNVWAKLRELYPICDKIIKGKSKFNKSEVDQLIVNCKDKTYVEVREVFIKFRKKEDNLLGELGIDSYEFGDSLIQLSDDLQKIIDTDDLKTESEIRKSYTSEQFREFRLLLSALQKEEVYLNNKWNTEIKKIVKKKIKIPAIKLEIILRIQEIFTSISHFIIDDNARKEIRKSIPITFIGNLSTFLRAIESDINKQQYKKNKEILNKFIGNISKDSNE